MLQNKLKNEKKTKTIGKSLKTAENKIYSIGRKFLLRISECFHRKRKNAKISEKNSRE